MSPFRFQRPRPLVLRVWHWLDALVIFGLLATVLLRKTVFSWRTNSVLIEQRVAELGGSISTDAAVTLARELRMPMWEWHYTLGFALVGLLILRVVLAVVSAEQAPVRSFIRSLSAWRALPSRGDRHALHYLAVKVSYLLFYLSVVFMAGSGLALYYGKDWGIEKAVLDALKDRHEQAMWFFVAFVAVHVVGVVVAELRGVRGLVSDMIHGGS